MPQTPSGGILSGPISSYLFRLKTRFRSLKNIGNQPFPCPWPQNELKHLFRFLLRECLRWRKFGSFVNLRRTIIYITLSACVIGMTKRPYKTARILGLKKRIAVEDKNLKEKWKYIIVDAWEGTSLQELGEINRPRKRAATGRRRVGAARLRTPRECGGRRWRIIFFAICVGIASGNIQKES